MPQLDLMTFFTQFFWFSLGFSFFYILLLHFVMPVIALNLKFRKRRLDILANDSLIKTIYYNKRHKHGPT